MYVCVVCVYVGCVCGMCGVVCVYVWCVCVCVVSVFGGVCVCVWCVCDACVCVVCVCGVCVVCVCDVCVVCVCGVCVMYVCGVCGGVCVVCVVWCVCVVCVNTYQWVTGLCRVETTKQKWRTDKQHFLLRSKDHVPKCSHLCFHKSFPVIS